MGTPRLPGKPSGYGYAYDNSLRGEAMVRHLRTSAAVAGAVVTAVSAALLTPSVGHATVPDLSKAICDTYRAEHQGLILSNLARPIATRMVVDSGISLTYAADFINSTVSAQCPEFIYLLPRP